MEELYIQGKDGIKYYTDWRDFDLNFYSSYYMITFSGGLIWKPVALDDLSDFVGFVENLSDKEAPDFSSMDNDKIKAYLTQSYGKNNWYYAEVTHKYIPERRYK